MDMNALADRNVVVQLKTEALDVYGTLHETAEEIDVKDWWASVTSSQQSFTELPDKVRNRELERIRKELEGIRRNLPRELGDRLSEALRAEPQKPE